MPAEWAPHRAAWLAFPYIAEEWSGLLEEAQEEHAGLCRAIAEEGGEDVELLVRDAEVEARARKLIGHVPNVRYHRMEYGDGWTRDTAPIVLSDGSGQLATVRFVFNGWGGKYVMPGDDQVAHQVARAMGYEEFVRREVLEGGAIDVDGEGTLLTTESCLFEPNRNPAMDREALDRLLADCFGVSKIVWLKRGLLNDHTDGHIDTLARFVAPGKVVCMQARSSDDPNAEVMDELANDLAAATDAKGRKLEVIRIPSAGVLLDESGDVMPASYCNFYIANQAVIVPTYGSRFDDDAVAELARCFPGRRVIGRPSRAILRGGGSFHCMTQQEPEAGR